MLETLKFGGGNWANKTDSTLAYSDQYGNFKPLPFDFTRASSATVVNQSGLIETVQSGIPRIDFSDDVNGALLLETQRTNLITQSEAFGNTYWTKSGASIQGDPSTAGAEQVVNGDFSNGSTDWTLGVGHTVSGSKLNINGASFTYQSVQQTVSSGYRLSFSVSNYVSGTIRVYTGSGTASVRIDASSDGNFELDYIANGNTVYVQPTGGTFIGSIDNVSIKEVQGFTSPSADSPLNAFKLVEDTSTGRHETQAPSSLSGDLAFSFFAKKGENSFIQITNSQDPSAYANFDLNLGVLGSSNIFTPTIIDYGNGWYRCIATINAPLPINYARIGLITSSTSARVESYTGDGTSGVYIFGAQLEAGSYPTSYIPTQGSTVTVLRDECLKDDFSILTVGNSYTLFFDVDLNEKDDNKTFFQIKNTSGSTSFTVRSVLGGVIRVYNNLDFQYPTNNLGSSTNKWVVRIDGTSFKIFGAEGSLSGTLTTARDMGEGIFGRFTQTKINDFKVYNTALSDSECEALTQV